MPTKASVTKKDNRQSTMLLVDAAFNATVAAAPLLKQSSREVVAFFRRHWIGTTVMLIATLIFFWPMVIRLDSYSTGGDAMFNAWTVARDQHCILHQGCPNYDDGNIYFPHHDTMLYSESQLSTALVTLPLHFINENPNFEYNVATILSFFLLGWCMYLLAKYLSRGNEAVSLLAGLVFEFAPFRMAAIWHLQNLCMFCLPLAVLFILRYFDSRQKRYLWALLPTLLYVFFASWVQMVFVLIALGILVAGLFVFKSISLKPVIAVTCVIALAAVATLPLAEQYIRFNKANHAAFSILDQELYNSSVMDYFTPHEGTLIGKMYYHFQPYAIHNAYNLDSFSYHGITLYIIGAIILFLAWRWRKKTPDDKRTYALIATLAVIGLVGLIISLGPFLKFRGHYLYMIGHGLTTVIIMPYALVDKFLPQLHFIRGVGRASVLVLFYLCAALAFLPAFTTKLRIHPNRQRLILILVVVLSAIELMPLYQVPMSKLSYSYNLHIPAVYKYIVAHKEIDNIVIVRGNDDYPGAPIPIMRAEDVLWAGYHNRNIFNGYSGYEPPEYLREYIDFINFTPSATPEMKQLHLRYVLVDKQLSGPTSNKPNLLRDISGSFPKVYEDNRYALFKIT